MDTFSSSAKAMRSSKTNEVIEGHTNDKSDLELLDTVTDRNKLASTPQETFLLYGTNTSLEGDHISLVIPRLNVQGNDRLWKVELYDLNFRSMDTYLGDWFGLAGLLCVVLSDTLFLDPLCLGILFFIRAEKVDIFVVTSFIGLCGGSRSTANESFTSSAGSRERIVLS